MASSFAPLRQKLGRVGSQVLRGAALLSELACLRGAIRWGSCAASGSGTRAVLRLVLLASSPFLGAAPGPLLPRAATCAPAV